MNLPYLFLRLARRATPPGVVDFLMRRRVLLRPGQETTNAKSAADFYARKLAQHGLVLREKRVLVFGYGGRVEIGVELLRHGAAHATLCDKFAKFDGRIESALVRRISFLHEDVVEHARGAQPEFDVVVSMSVFEHLDDPESITAALAALTRDGGCHLHSIDLRDHVFRWPFEMLCYSPRAWRWLNPPSNLNRCRLRDYDRIFRRQFGKIELNTAPDLRAFGAVKKRIRPEFLTGNERDDAAICVTAFCAEPRRQKV